MVQHRVDNWQGIYIGVPLFPRERLAGTVKESAFS